MSKNVKILSSSYNPDTTESIVTITTDLGSFTATSKCEKEDSKKFNRYLGGEIAYMNALIMFVDAQLGILYQEKEKLGKAGLKNLNKQKNIQKKINLYEKTRKDWSLKIVYLKAQY